MKLTRREQVRSDLRSTPPDYGRGDSVNVDGIGMNLEVTTIKLGAKGWSIGVRDRATRMEWVVPAKNVWRDEA